MAAKRAAADTATISAAIKILVWGKFSPFEYEGPAVHGFRSALCLSGLPYRAAERRATIIVTEALRRIGARRPSWMEGQPEHVATPGWSPTEYWFCTNCGRPMELSTASNGNTKKYCSDLCRGAVRERRARASGQRQTKAEYLAALAVRRAQRREALTRPCVTCGQSFVGDDRGGEQRFCSNRCITNFRGPPRPCPHCGAEFQPRPTARYCSPRCRNAAWEARQRAKKLAPELAPDALQQPGIGGD